MTLKLAIASLFFYSTAVLATANVPCRFAIFRPNVVLTTIERDYPQSGLSIARGIELEGLPSGRLSIMRGPVIVGQIEFVLDVQRGYKRLTVWHAAERVIKLEIVERDSVCPQEYPAGLCHRIWAYTDLQPILHPYFPFMTEIVPGELQKFHRYSKRVDFATFSSDFREALEWLKGVFQTTQSVVRPRFTSSLQRLRYAIASDPELAPYVDRFTFSTSTRDPRMIAVHGTVPSNFLYGRVIDRIRDAGWPYVDPAHLIIDTRTRIDPPPILLNCSSPVG
jgi:hypothetical protein